MTEGLTWTGALAIVLVAVVVALPPRWDPAVWLKEWLERDR